MTKQEKFITRAKEIHGEKYDYSKSIYVTSHQFITIICPIHGSFEQRAYSHIQGVGCKYCGCESSTTSRTTSMKDFLQKAGEVHDNKYDYSLVKYINTHTRVKIICPTHGEFTQIPNDHLRGCGCLCCREERSKQTRFQKYGNENYRNVKKARQTKLEKYDDKYYTNREKSKQTSMEKYGVNHPKQKHMLDILPLIDDYDWLFDQYITQHKTASQIATDLGVIGGTIIRRLHQFNISIKKSRNFSQMCILWLNGVVESENICIQHGENGGEYKIPHSGYRADGYCSETNTIYEFHGDVFHGNPKLYRPEDRCHPYHRDITAGELYNTTINRENKIKELGYNLVVMWESDFKLLN